MRAFLSSLSLLTILPVPQKWTDNIRNATVFFPLAGFFIGIVYYSFGYLCSYLGFGSSISAFFLIVIQVVFTRAFHLDGLADTADGFWGSFDRIRRLEIMKDSSIGVFGVSAVVLVLLGKWIFVSELFEKNIFWALLPSAIISRFSMVILSGIFSYAREKGTGQETIEFGNYKILFVALSYTFPLILVFGPGSLFIFLACISLVILIGLISYYKIHGITGDVLGFTLEISEMSTMGLFAFVYLYFPGVFFHY